MKYAIVLAVAVLAGCNVHVDQPQSTDATSNPDYKVAFLFQHEGCRVYRFVDGFNNRYFVNCGASSSTNWTESCGKSCTNHMDVSTSRDSSTSTLVSH